MRILKEKCDFRESNLTDITVENVFTSMMYNYAVYKIDRKLYEANVPERSERENRVEKGLTIAFKNNSHIFDNLCNELENIPGVKKAKVVFGGICAGNMITWHLYFIIDKDYWKENFSSIQDQFSDIMDSYISIKLDPNKFFYRNDQWQEYYCLTEVYQEKGLPLSFLIDTFRNNFQESYSPAILTFKESDLKRRRLI